MDEEGELRREDANVEGREEKVDEEEKEETDAKED